MKVTQEKLPASQIGLEIEVSPEMSKKVYERVVQEYTRSANIPGFRKGKVPRQVLIQRVGATRLKAAAVEELVEDTLKEAVKQENIDALGNFQLRSSFEDLVNQFEPGQPLIFAASVDVPPEVTLKQYTGLEFQAEEIKPDPERVEKVLENYRDQLATLIPVEGRPAQLNDTAVVDFRGVLTSDDPDQEPEEVPGGKAEDFQLELQEGRFIEGFIAGIVGMSPGETKEIQATFPETYPQETVAGRLAVFTVTLKELKEKELPELDDELAQEVSEFETLAELRESLETRFAEEAAEKTKANQEDALFEQLLQQVEVDVPETLIEREVTFLLNQTAMQLQNQGVDIRQLFNQETIPRFKEQSRPEAVQRIKRTLALGEIAKKESIQVAEDELAARVEEILSELGEQSANIDRDRLHSVVSEELLKDKIVDWLLERSTVELVPEGTLTKTESAEAEVDAEVDADASTETVDTEAIEVVAEPVSDVEEPPTEPAPKKKRSTKTAKTEEPIVTEESEAAKPEEAEAQPAPKARKTTKKKSSDPEE